MFNNEEKSTLTGKLAGALMKVGDVHAKELSVIVGFYEPKVSMNLLKRDKESK